MIIRRPIPREIRREAARRHGRGRAPMRAHQLGLPKVMLRFQIINRAGMVEREWEEPAHSWTMNGVLFLLACVTRAHGGGSAGYGSTAAVAKTTSGTEQYSATYSVDFSGATLSAGPYASGGVTTNGIVVGTDATAFSLEDYVLGAPIGHGTGTGQLSYGVMASAVSAYDSDSGKWISTATRSMVNDSGATITVREVGFITSCYLFGASVANFLLARDVLESAAEVLATKTLTVSYELKITID